MIDPTQIYAVVLAGVHLLLISRSVIPLLYSLLSKFDRGHRKHLALPFLIDRHRYIGPWTRLAALRTSLLIVVTIIFCFLRSSDVNTLGKNAGMVAIANIAPMYLFNNVSFAADILNLSLATMESLHKEFGAAGVFATTIHIVAAATSTSKPMWGESSSRYGVMAGSLMAILVILSVLRVAKLYEILLRTRQILAVGLWYSLWRHLSTADSYRQWYTAGVGIAAASMLVLQILDILIVHRFFRHGFPRAVIRDAGNVVSVSLFCNAQVPFPVGHYLNLWVPGLGLRSCLESHPFVVVSTEHTENGRVLHLMIEPHSGWTRRLLQRSSIDEQTYFALFSGPHGPKIRTERYGTVVMVASGWGIMGQIPHLRQLIQRFNHGTTVTRRIHLVWQLHHIDDGAPARDLLNDALRADTVDNGYIMTISAFHRKGYLDASLKEVGEHQRLRFIEGDADWDGIIREEIQPTNPSLIQKSLAVPPERVCMDRKLIMVSADAKTRDIVRDLAQNLIDMNVDHVELDYQPTSMDKNGSRL